jgi:hypothetical protein
MRLVSARPAVCRTVEPDLAELLLRESRPAARPGFERELEQRLFDAPARRRRLRVLPRPVLAGAVTAAALAAAVLALSLAGSGPLTGSEDGVEATSDCRTVTVRQRERVPYIVESKGRPPRIDYRLETRNRQVKRCP